MLKNLEDELNCILLIRDGRRLLLTDTGRVVFERGLALLAEFRQLEAELSDINQLKPAFCGWESRRWLGC